MQVEKFQPSGQRIEPKTVTRSRHYPLTLELGFLSALETDDRFIYPIRGLIDWAPPLAEHFSTLVNISKQEGHDGPGSLTWVCEPRIFKLTDFGIKRAKVVLFTHYEGSPSSL